MPTRAEMLRSFIDRQPEDPFPRYALAMEYKNAGQTDEAWKIFEALLASHGSYTPAYLHAGNLLVSMGRKDDARATYQRGIEACAKTGDAHAGGELAGALSALG